MATKHYVSNSEESTRLFQNPFMEALSKVHYTVPLFVFIPIISGLFYAGASKGVLSFLQMVLWLIMGLFVWTITEYILNRYIFHYHPS